MSSPRAPAYEVAAALAVDENGCKYITRDYLTTGHMSETSYKEMIIRKYMNRITVILSLQAIKSCSVVSFVHSVHVMVCSSTHLVFSSQLLFVHELFGHVTCKPTERIVCERRRTRTPE